MSKVANTSPSFKTQLFSYSLGAGATLAAITSASGSIVYSGAVNLTVSSGTDQFIDLNGGGNDLRFFVTQGGGYNNQYGVGISPARVDNARFTYGNTIGGSIPAGNWSAASELLFEYGANGGNPFRTGAWNSGGSGVNYGTTSVRGYLPVRLGAGTVPSPFHYGWVDYMPSNNGSTATIFGYAYETTANASIAAGAVPEPAESAFALGVLALGAAGLHRLRQRRAANDQKTVD